MTDYYKIHEFKRGRFHVVDDRGLPVFDYEEDKPYNFDDVDDALNLRDHLNEKLRIRKANLANLSRLLEKPENGFYRGDTGNKGDND